MLGFLEEKTSTEFLVFNKYSRENKKTFYVVVTNKNEELKLGVIQWERGWRRYVFAPSSHTVYDSECLKTIIEYINNLMEERKK